MGLLTVPKLNALPHPPLQPLMQVMEMNLCKVCVGRLLAWREQMLTAGEQQAWPGRWRLA